jgi:hypothetical protein
MKIHASCHCGAIAYDAEIDLARVVICHCTDCQKLTGSAFRVSVGTTVDRFSLSGDPATYVKTSDGGARRAQAFCPNCGSPMFTYDVDAPHRLGLRVGCIEQRHELRPSKQIWCRSALDWILELGELPSSPRE